MTTEIKPRHETLEVNGLTLHYLCWGNESAPPMLLLHGTASHAHVWDRFAAALSHAYHIIALDQRGFGDSGWPADYRVGYAQENWVKDIDGVVTALRLSPLTLIGLSTGGNNAIHYTAAHPEAVERLVIVEMGPEAGKAGVDRVIQSIPAREEFDSEEEAVAYLTGSGGRADPELARAHALHCLKPLEDGRVALKGDPALRSRTWRRPLRTAEENWAAVHAITCSTLLIRGGESKLLTAETAERKQREMADCTLVTFAGAGHAVPLHRPVQFEAAVRAWLEFERASGT
jgi:pimeloyl-ACP methyl ester carboxylesterase